MKDEIEKKGRLTLKETWNVITPIISALEYAQTAFGCYHGNIKPSNIIKFKKGSKAVYKLSDFKSSDVCEKKGKKLPPAKMESLLDNEYLAPEYKFDLDGIEKEEEGKECDPFLNDVYALGILILDCLGFEVDLLRGRKSTSIEARTLFYRAIQLVWKLDGDTFALLNAMLQQDPGKRCSLEVINNFFNYPAIERKLKAQAEEYVNTKFELADLEKDIQRETTKKK